MVTRLYKQYDDNKRAWAIALEMMRTNISSSLFKPQMREVVSVTLTYLALQDNTNDIERLFRRINLLESKNRTRHDALYFLQDSLKIASQCSPDLSLYLVPLGEDDKKMMRDTMMFRKKMMRDTMMFRNPTMLFDLAKRKYVQFYGKKTANWRDPLSLH